MRQRVRRWCVAAVGLPLSVLVPAWSGCGARTGAVEPSPGGRPGEAADRVVQDGAEAGACESVAAPTCAEALAEISTVDRERAEAWRPPEGLRFDVDAAGPVVRSGRLTISGTLRNEGPGPVEVVLLPAAGPWSIDAAFLATLVPGDGVSRLPGAGACHPSLPPPLAFVMPPCSAIAVEGGVDLADWEYAPAAAAEIEWTFLFWTEPRPQGRMPVELPAADGWATRAVAREAAQLSLLSDVPDATVLIDGRPLGPAPLESEVPAGVHTIEVRADGYAAFSTLVELAEGEQRIVEATLVAAPTPAAVLPVQDPDTGGEGGEAASRRSAWGNPGFGPLQDHSGPLSVPAIEHALETHAAAVRRCAETALLTGDAAATALRLQLTIGPAGDARVQSRTAEAGQVTRCVIQVIEALTFPASDGVTTATLPVNFR